MSPRKNDVIIVSIGNSKISAGTPTLWAGRVVYLLRES